MTAHYRAIFNKDLQSKYEDYLKRRDNGDEEFTECSDETLAELARDDAESAYDDYCDMMYEQSKEDNWEQ